MVGQNRGWQRGCRKGFAMRRLGTPVPAWSVCCGQGLLPSGARLPMSVQSGWREASSLPGGFSLLAPFPGLLPEALAAALALRKRRMFASQSAVLFMLFHATISATLGRVSLGLGLRSPPNWPMLVNETLSQFLQRGWGAWPGMGGGQPLRE